MLDCAVRAVVPCHLCRVQVEDLLWNARQVKSRGERPANGLDDSTNDSRQSTLLPLLAPPVRTVLDLPTPERSTWILAQRRSNHHDYECLAHQAEIQIRQSAGCVGGPLMTVTDGEAKRQSRPNPLRQR